MAGASVGMEGMCEIVCLKHYFQDTCPSQEPGSVFGALHVLSHHEGGDIYLSLAHEEADSEW